MGSLKSGRAGDPLPDPAKPGKESAAGGLVRFEDALQKIGGFGTFQFIASIALSAMDLPGAMAQLSPIFIGNAHIQYTCGSNSSTGAETAAVVSQEDICNATWSCAGELRSHQEFHTVVQEWDLICDRSWIPEFFTSIQMTGSLLGGLFGAWFADTFGRKLAFFSTVAVLGSSGFLCALAPNPELYAVTRFITGFSFTATFVVHYNYMIEFMTPRWRPLCGCLNFWPAGEMLLALAAYLTSSWRQLSWVASAPAFAAFLVIGILPESPRFLLCKGRTDEAGRAFDRIAKINRKPCLAHSEVEELQKAILQEESKKMRGRDVWKIFRKGRLLLNLLIFSFIWFASAFTYFGLSFNTKNLEGNIYLNVFYLGLVDFPAAVSGIYFSNKWGRRRAMTGTLILSSLILGALVLIEIGYKGSLPTLLTVFCLIGRFCNEFSYGVMVGFTGESFPTVGRAAGFSFCTTWHAIGAVLAPQMVYIFTLSRVAPYVIYFVLAATAVFLSRFLTEMKGKPLEDLVHGPTCANRT